MRIAFIGFGEAARAFRASLAATDPGLGFACYDILFESEGIAGPTARTAAAAGVHPAATSAEAVAAADWIFSAVTAASSLQAAQAAAARLRPGQLFLDINSVSPARKRQTAGLLPTGVIYADTAVMAPVHPDGHRTPLLLSGRFPPEVPAGLDRLGFRYEIVGDDIGGAAAIKLARSVFVKGLEAITVEALLAADAAGCLDRVARSLAASFPGLGWPDFAACQVERSLTHGVRRAAEMRECAAMLDGLGLESGLARSVAALHDRMGATSDAQRLRSVTERVRAALDRDRKIR